LSADLVDYYIMLLCGSRRTFDTASRRPAEIRLVYIIHIWFPHLRQTVVLLLILLLLLLLGSPAAAFKSPRRRRRRYQYLRTTH